MIEIEKLTRRYGDFVAVRDISTRIERGEIVGLLGHNGAGKTTMMKVLTGFLEPSGGQVKVDGHDVVSHRQEVQRLIGYLPESAPSYPEMLVQDYLLMMAGLRGVPEADRVRAVAKAVRATGLEKRLVQPIGELSKGFKQRVGLAGAILHDPQVLVLDEPTNGLDPAQIASIRTLITRLGENTTILLSTHILQEIEAVCDRVLVLMSGRLVADAPLSELVASRSVLISLASDTDRVGETLSGLEQVERVEQSGADPDLPGFTRWTVVCVGDAAAATPVIARTAVEAGWTLGSIAREQVSLESVFRRLQAEQAEASA